MADIALPAAPVTWPVANQIQGATARGAGLEELVVFEEDEDGNYGPDNLNYDRIPAAHQVVLRDHEARILELEERLAALENGDD